MNGQQCKGKWLPAENTLWNNWGGSDLSERKFLRDKEALGECVHLKDLRTYWAWGWFRKKTKWNSMKSEKQSCSWLQRVFACWRVQDVSCLTKLRQWDRSFASLAWFLHAVRKRAGLGRWLVFCACHLVVTLTQVDFHERTSREGKAGSVTSVIYTGCCGAYLPCGFASPFSKAPSTSALQCRVMKGLCHCHAWETQASNSKPVSFRMPFEKTSNPEHAVACKLVVRWWTWKAFLLFAASLLHCSTGAINHQASRASSSNMCWQFVGSRK